MNIFIGKLNIVSVVVLKILSYVSILLITISHADDATEVSASVYPWELHDEGVDSVIDNLVNMASVNSVYLVGLMHHEPRPYKCERFPHNPVRSKWFAEDSKVSWMPDIKLYGKFKPKLSNFDWLNKEDWLDVLIRGARKEGLKVGVELSHTIFETSFIKGNAEELAQRNVKGDIARIWRNKPIPCINNDDVRRYIIDLYEDLSKNYDLDFIQTCILNFAFKGGLENQGCFCDSCAKAASKYGVDLKEIQNSIISENNVTEKWNIWKSFRRKSVNSLYDEISDVIRENNQELELRIGLWNPDMEREGIYIEDLIKCVDSVRLMTYEEQEGKPERLARKESWINSVRSKVGDDFGIYSAIGVRQFATPKLIEMGIETAFRAGTTGITLGHYDAASFPMLRGVRSGLVKVGRIKEDRYGYEAESQELSGYCLASWLDTECVGVSGEGSINFVFDGEPGVYDIQVSYADEKGGIGEIRLLVNDVCIDTWLLDRDYDCWSIRSIRGVDLNGGESIKLVAKTTGDEWGRIDHVALVKVDVED